MGNFVAQKHAENFAKLLHDTGISLVADGFQVGNVGLSGPRKHIFVSVSQKVKVINPSTVHQQS